MSFSHYSSTSIFFYFNLTHKKGGNTNLAPDVRQRIREREANRSRRRQNRIKAGIKNHRIGEYQGVSL